MAPRFHPLTVTDIRRDTPDAVVVTLAPEPGDSAVFDFTEGQYLTFRRDFDGEELRRSYSICAGPAEGVLKVGIKRVDGGAFSTFANEELRVGDRLEAMSPQGRFMPKEGMEANSYLAFAAGSGITPVISILKTVLSREPEARATLVYANRASHSIMFREDLEDLKNLHMGRLAVVHVLDEHAEVDLFSGPLDGNRLDRLFATWVDVEGADAAFICGPEPLMKTIAGRLEAHGMDPDRIRYELFASGQQGRAKTRAASREVSAGACEVTLTLDGVTRCFGMERDGTAVLDAALGQDIDAPFSCKAGVCSTCRAKVTEGAVRMEVNHALEDYEVTAGYVLSCQCVPLGDKLTLTYDA